MLSIAEELFLLALDDDEGKIAFSGPRYASAGAILLELVLANRIVLSGKHLVVQQGTLTGDVLLNRALTLMQESPKPRAAKHWVRKIAGSIKDMDEQISERLIQRGIIRREEHRILWVFPAKRYPILEDDVQDSVVERVHAAIVGGDAPDSRTLTLIGLAKGADLLKRLLTKDERKTTRRRVDALIASHPTIAAVAKAVKDAAGEDAAMVATAAGVAVVVSS